MDRRSFLKGILATVVASTVNLDNIVESIVADTISLTDDEFQATNFVAYITIRMNIWVHNPSKCGFITGITE